MKNWSETFIVTFRVAEPPEFKDYRVTEGFVLKESSLWKLKNFVMSLGQDVSGKVEITLEYMNTLMDLPIKVGVRSEARIVNGVYRVGSAT
ncbi:MAG: hypothetical protein AB1742_00320 [bacterium]